jgi:prepilin-type N-terminal cleavage/methylation domain-containing protein
MTVPAHHARARRGEAGMTLIEVMVAMVIVLVGALGVMTTLDTGNQVTTANLARDGALGLAREQLEQSREMVFADLTQPMVAATQLTQKISGSLLPSLASTFTHIASTPFAVPAAVFTTKRRNVTYDSTFSTCVLDDPADGIGATEGAACVPLPTSDGGGTTPVSSGPGATTLGLNVLGIPITGAGALADILCALIGRNSILDGLIGRNGALSGLVSSGADVGVCSSVSEVAVDPTPDDAVAVTSVVHWSTPAPGGTITLRTMISGPRVAS